MKVIKAEWIGDRIRIHFRQGNKRTGIVLFGYFEMDDSEIDCERNCPFYKTKTCKIPNFDLTYLCDQIGESSEVKEIVRNGTGSFYLTKYDKDNKCRVDREE